MPLRDHFRPPLSRRFSWEGFHGGWPMQIVQELVVQLPEGFIAEPRVHLGSFYEIDVSAVEELPAFEIRESVATPATKATVTAPMTLPTPTLTLDTDLLEQYTYEVLVFDVRRERRLVAAIEIVSPANKDRPDNRQLFIAKCLNLLRSDVCVSMIDLVTTRQFNLFYEMLALLDPSAALPEPPVTYAATCRKRQSDSKTNVDTWCYPLAVDQPLPTIPIWLGDNQALVLDLEASYERTCSILRIA